MWDQRVAEYSEKQQQADSLEKRELYRSKVDVYLRRARAKRCLSIWSGVIAGTGNKLDVQ